MPINFENGAEPSNDTFGSAFVEVLFNKQLTTENIIVALIVAALIVIVNHTLSLFVLWFLGRYQKDGINGEHETERSSNAGQLGNEQTQPNFTTQADDSVRPAMPSVSERQSGAQNKFASRFLAALKWCVDRNYLFRLSTLFVNFVRSLLEIDRIGQIEPPIPVGNLSRHEPDMARALHFGWHAVVYIPVLIVCAIAIVLQVKPSQVLFFLALATSTVSLEICIGIILAKAIHVEDLKRQTTRAIIACHKSPCATNWKWIKYFQIRHHMGRVGVAKAALVTTFSVVLFSSVVGIETMRMREHSRPVSKKIAHLIPESEHANKTQILKEIDELTETVDGVPEYILLALALFLASSLGVIAVLKLWIQTRQCLEETDPMDRFATPQEALDSIGKSGVSHYMDASPGKEPENSSADSEVKENFPYIWVDPKWPLVYPFDDLPR